MADKLHEDIRDDLTQSFNMFAKDGVIKDINSFAKLMRHMGVLLSPAELQQAFTGPLTLQAFLDRMASSLVKDDTEADVIEAFKVFDSAGNGTIQLTELRFLLQNQGDKLDPEAVEQILARIGVTSGSLNYTQLVKNFAGIKRN
jgi:Ca2+-binding EF-hand superfamily protein